MTTGIMELMKQRRSDKNKNITEYKKIHTLIRDGIRRAKKMWLEEECKENITRATRHSLSA